MINEQKFMTRLEELELNEEFQKLPSDKKIILIAGEKILEMNEYLKNFFLNLENIAFEKFNAQSFKQELMDDILSNIQEKLNQSGSISKQEALDLINNRYEEEIALLEDKFHYTTEEVVNSANETFNEALERVESLSLFQVQAREEIRKNQDKIYILEEELTRQKEQNEILRNQVDERIRDLEDLMRFKESELLTGNFNFDGKFESFEDLERHISDKAREIAEEKIEEYLLNQNSSGLGFDDSVTPDMINNFIYNSESAHKEFLKVYEAQIQSGNKLTELEKLIDKQTDQINQLSNDRKELIYLIADMIKEKKFNSAEFVKYVESQNIEDLTKSEKEILKSLNEDDVDFLINNQARELVKEHIENNNTKSINEFEKELLENGFGKVEFIVDNDFESLQESLDELKRISETNNKTSDELTELDKKVIELQNQLQKQLDENQILRNELFDEITKNALYNSNNDNINKDNQLLINEYLYDGDDMKHNYYNGKTPIPGTKITRINNYRINNDLDNISYEESQEIIKSNFAPQNNFVEEQKVEPTNWELENQKIIDLENTVQRQEEEINRLRNQDKTLSKEEIEFLVKKEATDVVGSNYKQKEFMNSLEQTLSQLKELSKIQAQTVADLEKQSKKLEEVEQKVKNANLQNQQISPDVLDEIIEQKYKSKKDEYDYVDGLKKIEEERRKIDETLELERLRLLAEINLGTKKLTDLQEKSQMNAAPVAPTPIIIQQPVVQQPAAPAETPAEQPAKKGFFGRPAGSSSASTPSDGPVTVNGAPKKKRKQQIFYEVKVHTTPKLTKADLEK